MKAFAGAAVFGLVPVPTMPASYTYERNCDHRSTTTGDVNTSPLMVLPDYITERIASRDEFTRILARVLYRLRVSWPPLQLAHHGCGRTAWRHRLDDRCKPWFLRKSFQYAPFKPTA